MLRSSVLALILGRVKESLDGVWVQESREPGSDELLARPDYNRLHST